MVYQTPPAPMALMIQFSTRKTTCHISSGTTMKATGRASVLSAALTDVCREGTATAVAAM